MTILDRIVQTKRQELEVARARRPLAELKAALSSAPPPRNFFRAVTVPRARNPHLIAEIKKASPSAGVIVAQFDPVAIARTYAEHGASALSILTDEPYFQGRLEYIERVRASVPLPVLRKDFIVDEYQVYESRVAGADAILLIAGVLSGPLIKTLADSARSLGMTPLIEIHAEQELDAVVNALGAPLPEGCLLGINNRDLAAQETDLDTTERLARSLPSGTPFVAESGIANRDDVCRMRQAGACAILVGEHLLRAPDIGRQVRALIGEPKAPS